MKQGNNLLHASKSFFGKYWFSLALAGLFVGAILRAGWQVESAARKSRPGRPIENQIVPPAENNAPIKFTENIGIGQNPEPSELQLFSKPGSAEPVAAINEADAMAFLKRFAKVAIGERKKFGIPASVILATALVQSRAGNSEAAREANNFFMLPDGSPAQSGSFFSKNGQKYARFNTPWDSFRANSLLLDQRFGGLKKTAGNDWRAWANGLAKGGYSSQPNFEQALQKVVVDFHLEELDR